MEQPIVSSAPNEAPPSRPSPKLLALVSGSILGAIVGAPLCIAAGALAIWILVASSVSERLIASDGIAIAVLPAACAIVGGFVRGRRDLVQAAFFISAGSLAAIAIAWFVWLVSRMTFAF